MTPEQRAARERKQKIFVVCGGLFLVALLAFQLPKLLGGGGSSPAAATTATTATLPGQVARTPGTSTPGSRRAPAASTTTTAKLTSFSLFKPKDPFVQQVVTENGTESAGAPGEAAGKGPGAKGGKPTATFSTGKKAASKTIVTVNGERQVLEPGVKFPSADPLFVLVAEKPGAKSVVVGIVGGAYSGGAKTTTLKLGRPLTLVNTTTGARYEITLVSVGTDDDAEKPPAKP